MPIASSPVFPTNPYLLSQAVVAAESLYHRLVLVVGHIGSGKTDSLRKLAAEHSTSIINVNLELSAVLVDLPSRRRPLDAPKAVAHLIEVSLGEPVILDNLEMLFDTSLKLDPIACLKQASRNRTIVASFPGLFEDGHLIHAVPHHPEYHRFPAEDLLIVDVSAATSA